jgi:hypothetical protein
MLLFRFQIDADKIKDRKREREGFDDVAKKEKKSEKIVSDLKF